MGTICRTCGDAGYQDALILCSVCKTFAEHQYCLEKRPTDAGIKDWVCFVCKPKLRPQKMAQCTGEKLRRLQVCKYQGNRKGIRVPLKKGKRNRVLKRIKGNRVRNLKNSIGTTVISASQLDHSALPKTSLCGENSSYDALDRHAPVPMEVENISYPFQRKTKVEKLSRLKNLDMSLRCRNGTSNVVNMPQGDVSNRIEFQVTPEGDNADVEDMGSMSSNLKLLKKPRRRLILPEEAECLDKIQDTNSICDISSKMIVCLNSSLRSIVPISTLDIPIDPMSDTNKHVSAQKKRKSASLEEDQCDERLLVHRTTKVAREKALDVKENMRVQDHASSVILKDFDHVLDRTEASNYSRRFSSTQTNVSLYALKNIEMTSIACTEQNFDFHAKPIIDCVWRGSFFLNNEEYGPISAHVSNKACEKVWRVAKVLPPFLQMKMILRSKGWPESFDISPPTEENIALYFFVQDNWINRLNGFIIEEIMLKVILGEVELLVFSSLLLPKESQTFQGKHYFWGVFKNRDLRDVNNDETSCVEIVDISSKITHKNGNGRNIDETIEKVTRIDVTRHVDGTIGNMTRVNSDRSVDKIPTTPTLEKVKFDSVIQNQCQLTDQHNGLCMTIMDSALRFVDGHQDPYSNQGDGEGLNVRSSTLENVKFDQKLMEVNSSISITHEEIEDEFSSSVDEESQTNENNVGHVEFLELFERCSDMCFLCNNNKDICTLFPLQAEGMGMKMQIDESKPLVLELELGSSFTRKMAHDMC